MYQVYLRRRHPDWYKRFQYVSTSGVNAGIGICGLLIMLLTYIEVPTVKVGPQPGVAGAACAAAMDCLSAVCGAGGTCTTPSANMTCAARTARLPAVDFQDVACWNLNTGCNTPWPSE